MGTWYANLEGRKEDLKEVTERFLTGSTQIIESNGRFVLISSLFDTVVNSDEAIKTARLILKQVNGAMRAIWSGYHPIVLQSVAKRNDKGSLEVHVPFVIRIVDAPPGPHDPLADAGRRWLEKAEGNRSVAKLLTLLGQELDWVNLYRIWEVIQEDQGRKVFEKKWASEEVAGRFEQTANSYGAIGEASRHGHEKIPPPRQVMKLDDARALILGIARKWLEEKTASA